MSYEAERFEVEGMTVSICYEEDASFADPRDNDNLGTMVCWHPSYILGDEQVAPKTGGARDKHVFETENGRTDFRSMETIERYLRTVRGAVCILPLYLLDHSGISMSAGSNTVGRGDTAKGGIDSWGNARGWDTTMCGFIYATRESIAELCGECVCVKNVPKSERCATCGQPDNCGDCTHEPVCDVCGGSGIYKPSDYEGTALAWIATQLHGEVEGYNSWLTGEVYYFTVEDPDDPDVGDSCSGFVGDIEYAKEAARESAEAMADAKRANVEPDIEAAHFMAAQS